MADKKISELNAASTVADSDDLPLVQAAETKQVNASVIKTYVNTAPAIVGGTIDNAVIGASTQAAGAFTSLTSSSTTTLNGTTIPASKTLLVTTDIGTSVQAYDSDLTAWAGKTAPTGDAVGTSDSQTLTNKTISGSNNTLSNIGNSSLTNSSITINGNSVSLGGSTTVTASTTNTLTIGTGLSGTSFNGGSAVTIAIDSTVATLTGTQTLTNKTISGASNTLSDIGNASLTNSSITFGSTATSLGGTVSALNGVSVGATTASTGAFTTLSASSTVSGTGFSTYLASPPAIGGTTPAAGNFTTLGTTGNVTLGDASGDTLTINAGTTTFAGTGQRITGDFSTTTIANRLMFQTSTVNGQTSIGVLPNGTSTSANINLFGGTDPANASIGQLVNSGTEVRLGAQITGTGTYLPMTFYTGGSERVRIGTSGIVGVNTTIPTNESANGKLVIVGNAAQNANTLATSNTQAAFTVRGDANSGYLMNHGNLATSGFPYLQGSVFNGGSSASDIAINPFGGNVGIGTSSPYSQLDVYSGIVSPTTGEAAGVGSIRITNGASALSSAGGLEFKNAGDSNGYGAKIQSLNSGGSQLVFANRNASATWVERLRIDASGNVGIGGASTGAKLYVTSSSANDNIGFIQYENTSTSTGNATNAQLIGKSKFGTVQFMMWESNGARIGIRSTANGGNGNLVLTAGGDIGRLRLGSDGSCVWTPNGSTSAMTLDSAGNLAIGTTTMTNGNLTVQQASATTGGPALTLWNSNGSAGNVCGYLKFFSNSTARAQIHSVVENSAPFNGDLRFSTGENALTERVRIDAAGRFLVKKTSTGFTSSWGVVAIGDSAALIGPTDTNAILCANAYFDGTWKRTNAGHANILEMTYSGSRVQFFTSASSSAGSGITFTDGPYITPGSNTWTNGSDEKLKNITGEIENAVAKVMQIRAARFTWKKDPDKKPQVGLIAQDLQKVLPEVVAEPDQAMDQYGNETYLGVNYDQVIPLLVAAIKELHAEIEQLKSKLN